MNAGQMLGLLAGAGALNALSGGKDGKRFNSIVDMFDGGGAGQSGDKFEGGGLLSILGNLFAKPYEAQDRVEQIASRTAMRNTPTTSVRPQPRPADLNIPLDAFGGAGPNITGAAAERGMGLDPFGGAGPNITGAAAERGMGLDAFGGYGPEYTAPSYANMPYGEMGRMGEVPMQQDVIDLPEIKVAGEYTLPSVEDVLQDRATNPIFGPLAALNAQEYLEYLRTGRYPSGY